MASRTGKAGGTARRLSSKRYRERNAGRISEKAREYRRLNKDRIAEYQRRYHAKHRERLRSYYRALYQAKREERLASAAVYRAVNKKRIAEWQRAYRERNKEKLKAKRAWRKHIIAENQRQYVAANAEKVAAVKKAWRDRNVEHIREYNRRRYWANPEAERERCRQKAREITKRVRYGNGRRVEKLSALLNGKGGEIARIVAQEAKRQGNRFGFGEVLEDVVQDVIVEMLCSPPPADDIRKHARRLLNNFVKRRTYRMSGVSFEECAMLKRTVLGERKGA